MDSVSSQNSANVQINSCDIIMLVGLQRIRIQMTPVGVCVTVYNLCT